jgi:hypothetical protein
LIFLFSFIHIFPVYGTIVGGNEGQSISESTWGKLGYYLNIPSGLEGKLFDNNLIITSPLIKDEGFYVLKQSKDILENTGRDDVDLTFMMMSSILKSNKDYAIFPPTSYDDKEYVQFYSVSISYDDRIVLDRFVFIDTNDYLYAMVHVIRDKLSSDYTDIFNSMVDSFRPFP